MKPDRWRGPDVTITSPRALRLFGFSPANAQPIVRFPLRTWIMLGLQKYGVAIGIVIGAGIMLAVRHG